MPRKRAAPQQPSLCPQDTSCTSWRRSSLTSCLPRTTRTARSPWWSTAQGCTASASGTLPSPPRCPSRRWCTPSCQRWVSGYRHRPCTQSCPRSESTCRRTTDSCPARPRGPPCRWGTPCTTLTSPRWSTYPPRTSCTARSPTSSTAHARTRSCPHICR